MKLFALRPQNFVIWTKTSIEKKVFLSRQVNILDLYFLKVLNDTPNLLIIVPFREFKNYCWTFFANSMAGFNLLWRNITTKLIKNIDDFLLTFSTSLAMSITSRHSLLEYWAFAQHWRSILVSLFDKGEFTFRETANSDWFQNSIR